MQIKNFRDLLVWQFSHEFVLDVYKLTKNFPEEEKFGVCSQLRRSAASICSNIVEGYTKSNKEFIRYLDIARASLEETKYHLILSNDLHYISDLQYKLLFDKTDSIGRMIYSLRSKL